MKIIEGKLGAAGAYKITVDDSGVINLTGSVHALDLLQKYAESTNTKLDDLVVGLIGKILKG